MKSIIAVLFAVALIANVNAQDVVKKNTGGAGTTAPAAKTTDVVKKNTGGTGTPAAKPPKGALVGKVCTLVGCVSGKMASPSKEEATSLVSRGELLCLCVGSKCYIVLNSDGSNASSKLAALSGGNVTVVGKTLSKGGCNVVMANSIQ